MLPEELFLFDDVLPMSFVPPAPCPISSRIACRRKGIMIESLVYETHDRPIERPPAGSTSCDSPGSSLGKPRPLCPWTPAGAAAPMRLRRGLRMRRRS